MSTLVVVTYGFGDLLCRFFNAVVATMGESTYRSLLSITVLLAGFSFAMKMILKRNYSAMMHYFAAYYFVIYVLFIPKVTVQIEDRIHQGGVYIVDNVPLGLGIIASGTSVIGSALTEIVDRNFTMPDDIKYTKTGMVMASNLVEASSHFQITDPEFASNLRRFTKQCIFYDIYLGKYTKRELFNSNNIWAFVKEKASPLRAFAYRTSGDFSGKIVTCREGVPLLEKDWQIAINKAGAQYGSFLFGKNSDQNAKTQLFSYLGNSYSFLLGVSDAGGEILRQNLMATAIIDAASANNPLAAANSYSYAKAQMQQRLTHRTIGQMAVHWLPLMNSVFQAIMYGSFIFILLLAMLPSGAAILKNYVYSIMWLQLWAPLFAIINMIVSYYAQARSGGTAPDGFTLSSMSGLAQINSDMAGLAGYMSMSVPFLSAGIVKGMSGVFTSISQYVGGITQSAASSSAAEAASGNISLGNTSFSTHSANNTSANHFNTSGSMMSGGFSRQLASGSIANTTPDGGLVLDSRSALSNTGAKISWSQHMSKALTQAAGQETSAGHSSSVAYSEAHASAFRKAINLASHQDKSTGNTSSSSVSTSADATRSANHIQQHIHRLSKDLGVSEDAVGRLMFGVAVEAGAGLPLQGLTGLKGNFNTTFSGNVEYARKLGINYSDLKHYMQDNNLTESINTVERAAKDHQFRANTDEGKRLVSDLNSSYEKSDNLRNEANSHFQKANRYTESANLVNQNSAGIDYQGVNQRWVDWLSKQNDIENPQIKMTQDHIDYITRGDKDPILTKQYAEKFIREEGVENFVGNIQDSHVGQVAGSPEKIESYHNNNSAQIQNQHSISTSKYDNQVKGTAAAYGLDLNKRIVDDAPEKQADQLITQNAKAIQFKEHEMINKKEELAPAVAGSGIKIMENVVETRNKIANQILGLNNNNQSNSSSDLQTSNKDTLFLEIMDKMQKPKEVADKKNK